MRSFIITLLNNDLSQQMSQDCVAQARKFGIDPQVSPAIDGRDGQIHLDQLKISPTANIKKKIVTPGMIGCLLSHYYLWLSCAQQNETYFILEHDGYMIRPLPRDIEQQFTGILKLDSLSPYQQDYETRLVLEQNRPWETFLVTKHNHHHFNYRLKRTAIGSYSSGSYGYLISPGAAQQLIGAVNQHGFYTADKQLASGIAEVRSCHPTVVRLHPFYLQADNIYQYSTTKPIARDTES